MLKLSSIINGNRASWIHVLYEESISFRDRLFHCRQWLCVYHNGEKSARSSMRGFVTLSHSNSEPGITGYTKSCWLSTGQEYKLIASQSRHGQHSGPLETSRPREGTDQIM